MEAIATCISRGALGFKWTKGMGGGDRPYLCPADMELLQQKITECAEGGAQMDATDVLDEASRLKLARTQKALLFLKATNSPNLASEINDYAIEPPTRSWLNMVLDKLDAAIKSRRLIDPKRLAACSKALLREYFMLFGNIIADIPKALLLGADETMIDAIKKGKVVVPASVTQALAEGIPNMPHMTAMCCHTVTGKPFTPMIILKELHTCPDELKEFVGSGLIHLASSPSGWQTRDTFLFWTLCLVNEMSFYRKTLDSSIRDHKALLIMDGHSSRECPMALIFLKARNIDVLILPSHATHVMQIFDVSIACPLKTYYGSAIKKLLHDMDNNGPAAPKIRHAVVEAFISAWTAACTYKNCINGAIKTGTCPVSFDKLCESPFVREFTREEEERLRARNTRRGLNINKRILTTPEAIHEVDEAVGRFERFSHLQLRPYDGTYQELAKKIVSEVHNGCRFLSMLPPFITNTDRIIYFNP